MFVCLALSDLQLLGPNVFVSMADFLLFKLNLFDFFCFFHLLALIVNDIFNNFENWFLIRIVWMYCWWLDYWRNCWDFIFALNFLLLGPYILYRLLQNGVFFNFVGVLSFGKRYTFRFESVGIKSFSNVIIFWFNNERSSELLSNFFGVFLLHVLKQSWYINVFAPLFLILLSLQAFDFDEISHFYLYKL